LKRKSQKAKQFFLTPTASKKAKLVKFGVKKANLATLRGAAACLERYVQRDMLYPYAT